MPFSQTERFVNVCQVHVKLSLSLSLSSIIRSVIFSDLVNRPDQFIIITYGFDVQLVSFSDYLNSIDFSMVSCDLHILLAFKNVIQVKY